MLSLFDPDVTELDLALMEEHIQVPLNPPNLVETQKSCKYTIKKYWQHWQLLQLKGKITQTLQIYSCTSSCPLYLYISMYVLF